MQCELIALADADPSALAADLRALVPTGAEVSAAVSEIVAAVRERGDEAVLDYTRRFDAPRAKPLRVEPAELENALARLDRAVRGGLERAIENVSRVAEAGLRGDREVVFEGHTVTIREAPVASAGVYVPGGRAPYPSTVVMGVIPARVAGVGRVSVCAPPAENGEIDPTVLAACRLTEASEVYRMGGAQAVAALAYGTESIAPVDVIVGPGNLYVQEAKRQVFGQVGIDGFAGPSDLVVIATAAPDPEPVALDLLAQAEHGPAHPRGRDLHRRAAARAARRPDRPRPRHRGHRPARPHRHRRAGARARPGARARAPGADRPRGGAPGFAGHACRMRVRRTPEPHSATTSPDRTTCSRRAARPASPPRSRPPTSAVASPRSGSAAPPASWPEPAAPLARAEGFELHAQSMEARVRDNGPDDPLG